MKRTSIAVYILLIFSSAALVFSVQPIVGRMLLPRLGGTTVVWNTCLVFFQAALLAGYFYADLLSRKFPLKAQVPIHLGMLLVAGLALPIAFPDVSMPSDSLPAIWLLGQLTLSVGFPFLVISASAPLFQSWFARTGLPSADNPYYLYAASNLGSILSLVAYPFLIEPKLGVDEQSMAWAWGYLGLGFLIVTAGALTWKLSEKTGLRAGFAKTASEPISIKDRFTWGYLAMIPSALLVAVSAHITADVAPVPFLWMVPLVLFLLTFVIAFARRKVTTTWLISLGLPATLLLAFALSIQELAIVRTIEFNVLVFFLVALLFHMTLAALRPGAERLTSYYLMMSLGGVVGGAFTALLAPLIFESLLEYPILLVASLATLPLFLAHQAWPRAPKIVFALLMLAVGVHIVFSSRNAPAWYHALMVGLVVLAIFSAYRKPAFFGVAVAALVFTNLAVSQSQRNLLYSARSYFGAYEVERTRDGEFTLLHHGSTLHGKQATDPEKGRYPLQYYATDTGIGRVFSELDKRAMPQHVGAIGLGIGSIAAYIHQKRTAEFFEIDPLVFEIANNPKFFTYLPACGKRCTTIIGDGRIEIGKQSNAAYDLVILDAFNSDAVPVHLLTSQAIDLYFEKVKPGGLLAIHLTNGYLRLPEVAARLANEGGYAHVLLGDGIVWMVMARDAKDLGKLPGLSEAWHIEKTDVKLWTDDFADILGSIKKGGH